MPLNLRKIHIQTQMVDPTTGEHVAKITGVHPVLRFCNNDRPPVYVQDGHFYPEEGDEIAIEDLPEYITMELKKCSEKALREVGLNPKDWLDSKKK